VHVLVTGHTGFKGSWLSLWLAHRGHRVSGVALDPQPGSLFDLAEVSSVLDRDLRIDVRDPGAVRHAMQVTEPDVVVHMAAQPLVRASYLDPRLTFEANVMGTLSVLEAVAAAPSVSAQVIVTTDKVYRNIGQSHGYVEGDALGGDDPYSASKAMADIMVASWVRSFGGCPTAVARAGNVIGGGDVSADRLLPDLLRAFSIGEVAHLRYPGAVRPWQHVLDCLNGYLALIEALVAGEGTGAWNFGPSASSFRTVGEVADLASASWGPGASWTSVAGEHPHEAELLTLDASRAIDELSWSNRLQFDDAVSWTVEWSKKVGSGSDARAVTMEQIRAFEEMR
jgi:CDP-glucose 4,6-dehydratase